MELGAGGKRRGANQTGWSLQETASGGRGSAQAPGPKALNWNFLLLSQRLSSGPELEASLALSPRPERTGPRISVSGSKRVLVPCMGPACGPVCGPILSCTAAEATERPGPEHRPGSQADWPGVTPQLGSHQAGPVGKLLNRSVSQFPRL